MTVLAEATAADWLSAWGQVGGAVGTVAAVGVALWLAGRDSRWRRAEAADRDAAQARLVTINVVPFDPIEQYPQTTDVVTVHNGSGQPILDVSIIEATNPGAPGAAWKFDQDTAFGDVFTIEPRVIAAGEKFVVPIYFAGEKGAAVVSYEATSVTVQFTDANGLIWRRTDSRAPTRHLPAAD